MQIVMTHLQVFQMSRTCKHLVHGVRYLDFKQRKECVEQHLTSISAYGLLKRKLDGTLSMPSHL